MGEFSVMWRLGCVVFVFVFVLCLCLCCACQLRFISLTLRGESSTREASRGEARVRDTSRLRRPGVRELARRLAWPATWRRPAGIWLHPAANGGPGCPRQLGSARPPQDHPTPRPTPPRASDPCPVLARPGSGGTRPGAPCSSVRDDVAPRTGSSRPPSSSSSLLLTAPHCSPQILTARRPLFDTRFGLDGRNGGENAVVRRDSRCFHDGDRLTVKFPRPSASLVST